jgi:aspartyl-tRNA(Asn)/glutamyl-tRNA(Gln) amidotransferase subunit A
MRITETSERLRRREISPVELTQACLQKIEELNPGLNAFITVTAESALAEARVAEREIASGHWRGPLHGIPIALKDNIDTAGVSTTAGSNLFRNRIPLEDAEVVCRLKAAGAVFLGKTNMHEFAYGGSSVISAFGPVRNPWNTEKITGGSSGGSAAAVAAGLCLAAIGTDTAGSIREPASLCGVVGLKPTYGRVSSRGVIPLSASLDHTGPIAQCAEDAALLLLTIAGYDPGDPSSVNASIGNLKMPLQRDISSLRIGVARDLFWEGLHPEIERVATAALNTLSKLCRSTEEVALTFDIDRTLQTAEAWRYHKDFVAQSPELYQPETLRRIRTGDRVSQSEHQNKLEEQQEVRRNVGRTFESIDLLITPTVPALAGNIQELLDRPETLRPLEVELLRNTRPFNVWGLPSISLPCGFTQDGMPIGIQISAAPWREDLVLTAACAYERATNWSRPPQL